MREFIGVIEMTIEELAGAPKEELAAAIVRNVELAQRISKRIAPVIPIASARPGLVYPEKVYLARLEAHLTGNSAENLAQAMAASPAIGATSSGAGIEPPVAGSLAQDLAAEQVDYWESRTGKGDGPERLRAMLAQHLPPVIEVAVPGLATAAPLHLSLEAPGSPMTFVRVNYRPRGHEMGPSVLVNTSDKTFFTDRIVDDIRAQAACSYAVDRKPVVPQVIPMRAPSDAEIARLAVNGDAVSGEDAAAARETAKMWGNTRSSEFIR